MSNVLITGIRGFIGFNAIQKWITSYSSNNYIGIDARTYADEFLIDKKNTWLDFNFIKHYQYDISDQSNMSILENIIEANDIDTIINFAAESHVDNSIKNPNIFFQSNVIGLVNILNLANKYNIRVHHVSTDEVIGSKTPEDYTKEDANYDPSSPYSSSKASAELIALSYYKTFGTKVTISRCTNNIGPWQMSEKMVPTIICNAMNDKKIPVYGNGLQRRFWIDVDRHNDAIMKIVEKGICGQIYNISPKKENLITNIDLVKMILKRINKSDNLIEFVKDRPAHDTCYFLEASKIKNELGFEDDSNFNETLDRTIEWYRENI